MEPGHAGRPHLREVDGQGDDAGHVAAHQHGQRQQADGHEVVHGDGPRAQVPPRRFQRCRPRRGRFRTPPLPAGPDLGPQAPGSILAPLRPSGSFSLWRLLPPPDPLPGHPPPRWQTSRGATEGNAAFSKHGSPSLRSGSLPGMRSGGRPPILARCLGGALALWEVLSLW